MSTSPGTRARQSSAHTVLRRALIAWWRGPRGWRDRGMSTAEYAVGTLAAVAFAGLLYAAVTSSAARTAVDSLVQRALSGSF
ncbi:hypothetical protein FAIPA1_70115 [Frankia sp. AiPs1]|uniref:DUF4244 domain-containing protein n=1 Tax=Frankia sp. AiPa1 TaxID=573492 RepID=UPI00202B2B3A|nr:DUF4244 domain-containing protein [Frankia sp. AiPa1]MCL9761872.1 DUF4244 domain-containing protein [Frankia sp. AiPa1]